MAHSEPSDLEIVKQLRPEEREMLPVALSGILAEMAPAAPQQIAAGVARIIGITATHWSRETRAEYIALVVDNLMRYPGEMVLRYLDNAQRAVTRPAELLKWICEDIDVKVAKLELELKNLQRIDAAVKAVG